MAAILWKFKLFDVSLILLQIRNLRPRISGMRLFWTLFIHFLTPIYYLPKFSIFASMFVWRFVTCQNFFEILQVCSSDGLLLAKIFNFGKYVRLTVCLSVCLLLAKIFNFASMFVWPFVCLFVCLFVRNFFDTGHSFWYIFTKLDPSMCLCHVTMPIVFLGQRSNN